MKNFTVTGSKFVSKTVQKCNSTQTNPVLHTMWQLIGSYVFFINQSQYTQFSEIFALILFPCFGMEYFLLFALFTKNCIAPSQSDSINFFMYIIDNQISY